MDSDNLVVKLCLEGMRAEAAGRHDDARTLFEQAWAAHQDEFEACVAAHYVARHQKSPEETLRWNQEALTRADAAGDDRVQSFYPSLYLNLGWSHEMLGSEAEARKFYELAAQGIDDLSAGPYRDLVQSGIAQGRKRTATSS